MGRPRTARVTCALLAGLAWAACGGQGNADRRVGDHDEEPLGRATFWNNLRALCGRAFAGTVEAAPATDTVITGKTLVMHVSACRDDEVRVAFHVGDDRSRTWVITREGGELSLAHEHRHRDGSLARNTGYGGRAGPGGSGNRQEFPADSATAARSPATRTNVWSLELEPGTTFVYALERIGTERRFRIAFDLTQPISAPPPAWGN